MPSLRPIALAVALGLAAPALAQGAVRADSVAADTAHTDTAAAAPPVEVVAFGRSITYPDILAELALLQLAAPAARDTTSGVDPYLGITGLVVDETASPSGRLFYETFYLLWSPPPGGERATITLAEQPLPGNGTAILIRADGEILVQTRLPRRQEEVEDLARQAVQFVRQRLAGN